MDVADTDALDAARSVLFGWVTIFVSGIYYALWIRYLTSWKLDFEELNFAFF